MRVSLGQESSSTTACKHFLQLKHSLAGSQLSCDVLVELLLAMYQLYKIAQKAIKVSVGLAGNLRKIAISQ
jgi:hypothetical protein